MARMDAIKRFFRRFWDKLRSEPVAITNAITALIAAGVGFGLYDADVATEWSAVAATVVGALGTIFARSRVSPVQTSDRLDPENYAAG